MLSRGLILSALALWSVIVTSLLIRSHNSPTPANADTSANIAALDSNADTGSEHTAATVAPPSLTGLPFKSITMQLQRPDWVDKYITSIDEIAALGADTVMFVVDARQENASSAKIYIDLRMALSQPDLERLIRHAKSKNLHVILMPIVLLDEPRNGNEWRGTIKPEALNDRKKEPWDVWWESYTAMITHYAIIAQGTGVDLLVVGSELISTETQVDKWRTLIAHVRGIYKGKLTYSSNWDHYTSVKIWQELDMIGLNSYWSLDDGHKNRATVDDIKSVWKEIQYDLLPFAAKEAKPIMFLEAGWCSIANAASEPWDYTQTQEPIDLDLQRRLYQGYFESWYANPQLGGFSVWEWPPTDGGSKDRGYTPKGKPAEGVLRTWLGKPGWVVNPGGSGKRDNRRGKNR